MSISINFNLPFDEAIAQLAGRGVVLPEIYYGKLQGLHKQLAFSIANIGKLDQLQGVLDSLTEHLKNDGTFANWQKSIEAQSLGLPKYRLDNIFRTNVQQAYNHGQWLKQVENKSTHPYLIYDAINDSRTRLTHKANDGIIRKIDDPIWKRIWFSRNVYRCRCRLIALTEEQAIARSGNAKGLQQVGVEDLARDKSWDNVDVLSQDFLQVGIEKAVAARLVNPKINPVLSSAFNSTMNTLPEMKIKGFATVQKAMSELAVKKPEWFPDGFKGIHAVADDGFYAGHYQGTFYFSNADKIIKGFNPASELASAFKAIQEKEVLSFNQEYAIETLWHEIMHYRAMHTEFPKNVKQRDRIESIHQWLSRRTYQSLLVELNSSAKNQQAVISGGLAYQTEAVNFSVLLSTIGLMENAKLISAIEYLWLTVTPAQSAKNAVIEWLAKESGLKESKIIKAFSYLNAEKTDFKAKVKNAISY